MKWQYKFLSADQSTNGNAGALIYSSTEAVRLDANKPGRRGEIDIHSLMAASYEFAREFRSPMDLAVHRAKSLGNYDCSVRPVFPEYRSERGLAQHARAVMRI